MRHVVTQPKEAESKPMSESVLLILMSLLREKYKIDEWGEACSSDT